MDTIIMNWCTMREASRPQPDPKLLATFYLNLGSGERQRAITMIISVKLLYGVLKWEY